MTTKNLIVTAILLVGIYALLAAALLWFMNITGGAL